MNSIFRLLIGAIALANASGQSFLANFTSNVADRVSDALSAVECDDDTRATNQCNLTPFRGTYVCRPVATLFGQQIKQTVCARNIIQGFTLGSVDDTCGCCEETGCPVVCGCPCGENRVVVKASLLFGFINTARCVTNGWSQHLQAWVPGEGMQCVEADSEECLAFGEDEEEEEEEEVVFAEPAEISP